VYLLYVDESGNIGNPGSHTYTLACVFLEASAWPGTFDELIDFRRFLRAKIGLPVRAEIKENHILRNGGAFRSLGLSEKARYGLYRSCLRVQPKLGLQTFAIVIHKKRLWARDPGLSPREVAWEYLLQRVERLTTKSATAGMVMHDEGEGAVVRKLARKARRAGSAGSAFGTGSLRRPATLLVDDPVSRNSAQSYFVQLADLNAYAAFRRVVPPPARPVQIVPENMWDELGDARFPEANRLVGGVPGLVAWPRS
jgi:hypothetical protein